MKDRVVQYPHRYQLVQVSGQSDVYDLVAVPGTITEAGMPLNKATLLKDITGTMYGLESDGTPDDAFRKTPAFSSYLAFVQNADSNSLDAAFGKNNEDKIRGVGLALAMYAWFKGEDKDENTYTELKEIACIEDIMNNSSAYYEICTSNNLVSLVNNSPYAKAIFDAAQDSEANVSYTIANLAGLDVNTYTSFASLCTSPAKERVTKNEEACTYALSNEAFVSASTSEFKCAVFETSEGQAALAANLSVCNSYFVADRGVMALLNMIATSTYSTTYMSKGSANDPPIIVFSNELRFVILVGCGRSGYTAHASVNGIKYSAAANSGSTSSTTFTATTPINVFSSSCTLWGSAMVTSTYHGITYKKLDGLITR